MHNAHIVNKDGGFVDTEKIDTSYFERLINELERMDEFELGDVDCEDD